MLDNPDDPKSEGYGDAHSLWKLGIPVATVYNGQIGWHELRGGQLLFTAPKGAFTSGQQSGMQDRVNREQGKFLNPKPKHNTK